MGKADKRFDDSKHSKGMNQKGVDRGEKGETGEKIPGKASKIDEVRRGVKLANAVGMGKEDMPRNQSEVMENIHTNTSDEGDGHAYHHVREYTKERY